MKSRTIATALLPALFAVAIAAAPPKRLPDAESERVRLIERMERSVALVEVTARTVRHRRTAVVVDEGSGIASGVLLTADGVVLTAAHAVDDASRVSVRFRSGDSQSADVIFIDGPADIALLRVPQVPPGAEPATLGDSNSVRKGETLYIIGNPVGVEFSLSTGIVSGRHTAGHVFVESGELEMIQTDAAMNAGNSGGPMFNARGEVIAIAQRILTSSRGSEGLGFGLAINEVRKLLTGDPCLWLGFVAIALDGELAAALNVTEREALLIQSVSPGSPAEKAGLRGGEIPVQSGETHLLLGGDVILQVDGTPIAAWRRTAWTDTEEGTKHRIVLSVLRSGRTIEISVETIHRRAVLDVFAPRPAAARKTGSRRDASRNDP